MTFVKTTYGIRSFLKTTTLTEDGLKFGFSWLADCNPSVEEVLKIPDIYSDSVSGM